MAIPIGIASHKRGDTWDGMQVTATTTDSSNVVVPIDLTGVEIIAQFKTSIDGTSIFEFKTADNSITVPSPTTGVFYFQPRNMDYPAKMYFFDIQLKYPNGNLETIVPTHTWALVQDISR